MRQSLLALPVFCLLSVQTHATPLLGPILSPGQQCRAAIAAAERAHAIPAQLMAAIGRVESGRKDPATGDWGAWPWTINAEGQGFYFASKAEAIAKVVALQAQGVRSIDVGCMQVNLMHHPDAFPSLDLAFEPAVNTDYAARFLTRLHDQTNDWMKATANYHSAYPPEGEPYAAKVAEVWPEEQRKLGQAPGLPFGPGMGGLFGNATPPFPAHRPPRLLAQPGAVAPGAIAGHGLDFYRAMPVRMATAARILPRVPPGVLTR